MSTKQVTAQQIFNKVSKHLLTQGRKAGNGENCRYKKGELKCAIGCLIPEQSYERWMEDNDVEGLFLACDEHGMKWHEKYREHIRLLHSLQGVHDFWSAREWRPKLVSLAIKQGLKANVALRTQRAAR